MEMFDYFAGEYLVLPLLRTETLDYCEKILQLFYKKLPDLETFVEEKYFFLKVKQLQHLGYIGGKNGIKDRFKNKINVEVKIFAANISVKVVAEDLTFESN